jgi:hypothetical protein
MDLEVIMDRKLSVLFLLILFCFIEAYSAGTKWNEFKKTLDKYFAKELIADITNQEPLISNYDIHSWDVGDFSGDGYTDLALVAKTSTDRGRQMTVLMFYDQDGYILKAGEFKRSYVELPLEVGVAIRNGAAFVTEKQKQYEWEIKGYSIIGGDLKLVEDFVTKSTSGVTEEISTGYYGRPSSVRYIGSADNDILFDYRYNVNDIATGSRSPIEKGNSDIEVENVENILEGGYWWQDWDDLSYKVYFSTDSDKLYIKLEVKDDIVLDQPYAESIDLYFAKGKLDRIPIKKNGEYTLNIKDLETTGISVIPFDNPYSGFVGYSENKSVNRQIVQAYGVKTEQGYDAYISFALKNIGITQDELKKGDEIYFYITVNDSDDPDNLDRVTKFGTAKSQTDNPLFWNTLIINPSPVDANNKTSTILKEYGI